MPRLKDKIFLDASVIMAAVLSCEGGSFRFIRQSPQKIFKLFTSEYALDEVIRNLNHKYPDYLSVMEEIFLLSKIEILSDPSEKEVSQALKFIDFKDAPILASALKHQMNFLITLDRRHFFNQKLRKISLVLKILTPAQFIKDYFN